MYLGKLGKKKKCKIVNWWSKIKKNSGIMKGIRLNVNDLCLVLFNQNILIF